MRRGRGGIERRRWREGRGGEGGGGGRGEEEEEGAEGGGEMNTQRPIRRSPPPQALQLTRLC